MPGPLPAAALQVVSAGPEREGPRGPGGGGGRIIPAASGKRARRREGQRGCSGREPSGALPRRPLTPAALLCSHLRPSRRLQRNEGAEGIRSGSEKSAGGELRVSCGALCCAGQREAFLCEPRWAGGTEEANEAVINPHVSR